MNNISICLVLKNRADLFKYSLESIARQDYDLDKIEICILDNGSTDSLLPLIDRYSDVFTFKYCVSDKSKSYIPILTSNPAIDINNCIRFLPTYDTIIKINPEIIMRDAYLIKEMVECIKKDSTRHYNARTHFMDKDNWYVDYEDIIDNYIDHYTYVNGEPFSTSLSYFCSGFSRTSFIQMGGVEELLINGEGYDDALWREQWKNHFGLYEQEIDAQVIDLWYPPSYQPLSLLELNRRLFELLKDKKANNSSIQEEPGKVGFVECNHEWANIEMLSAIYTIKDSKIINVDKLTDNAEELDLLI